MKKMKMNNLKNLHLRKKHKVDKVTNPNKVNLNNKANLNSNKTIDLNNKIKINQETNIKVEMENNKEDVKEAIKEATKEGKETIMGVTKEVMESLSIKTMVVVLTIKKVVTLISKVENHSIKTSIKTSKETDYVCCIIVSKIKFIYL